VQVYPFHHSIFLKYLLPVFEFNSPIFKGLSKIWPLFAPYIAFIFLVPIPFALFNSWRKKKLLESQKNLATLKSISWKQFEELVGEAYRRQGYQVSENIGEGPDGGIDLRLRKNGELILVQCKHWKAFKVDVKVVREMYGVMVSKNASKAIVITSGTFTQPAKNFASDKPIELIEGKQLYARDCFSELLENTTKTEEILHWKEIIEEADITTYVVSNKVQATQIFSFQNDRGKVLTNFEKLKAHLMYQVYLSGSNEDAISYIEKEFEDIYRISEEIESDEDTVLNHHCMAFLGVSVNVIEKIKKESSRVQNKTDWIKDFSTKLKNSFSYVKQIEEFQKLKYGFISDLLILDSNNCLPLLIKIYHYHQYEIEKFEDIFGLIEITLMRMRYTRGDYRTNRFPIIAHSYDGNKDKLRDRALDCAINGFQTWWEFKENFEICLKGDYHYWKITRYLLWKYENYLREQKKEGFLPASDFRSLYKKKSMENTIEHIAPQTPKDKEYSDDFKAKCLNNCGNLVLMTLGKNARLGNKTPDKKDFQSPLLSQQEIECQKNNWNEVTIKHRQEKIVAFALDYWNPEKNNQREHL